MTSPGSDGAKMISPSASAVKVFWKNDSPPRNERLIDFRKPPVACVWIVMPPSIPTMAPLSARMVSPWFKRTRQTEYDGWYRISVCIGHSLIECFVRLSGSSTDQNLRRNSHKRARRDATKFRDFAWV